MRWYQVDSDTPNDPKIKRLIEDSRDRGGKAKAAQNVGHLFLLWCYVANHGEGAPGDGVAADGAGLPLKDMAYECLFDGPGDLVDFLDLLAKEDLIEAERWQTQQIVILPAMRKRADDYAKRKGRGSDPGRGESGDGGGNRGKAGRKTPDVPLQDTTRQHKTEDQTHSAPAVPDLLSDAGEDAVDALVRIWNTERKPGPAVRDITHQRRERWRRALQARPDLSDWRLVIGYLNGQPWCNAKGGGDHPNWRADLDWLAKPGNLARYHEKALAERPARADGVAGRNAGKGRAGYKPGEFAAALGGDDGPVH